MSSFQDYPEKKVTGLLDLAVTTQSPVFLWSPGGTHQHLGRVLKFTRAADILALSVLKDKAFHAILEKNFIDEVFVMMQVGKDQVYFKAAIRSGDDVSWSFHVLSPLYKLERRTGKRIAVATDMTSQVQVALSLALEDLTFKGPLRDLSTGGLAVLGREMELRGKVEVGQTAKILFMLGTTKVDAETIVVHLLPVESRKLGKKIAVGMRFSMIGETIVAEIAKLVARN